MPIPFHSGTDFEIWEARNCAVCKKAWQNNEEQYPDGNGPCELDNALTVAYITDGQITEDQYKRLGVPGACTELDV